MTKDEIIDHLLAAISEYGDACKDTAFAAIRSDNAEVMAQTRRQCVADDEIRTLIAQLAGRSSLVIFADEDQP